MTYFQLCHHLCRGSCWDWNEPWHRQHWRYLRNQHGNQHFLHFTASVWIKTKQNKTWFSTGRLNDLPFLHQHFRTTRQPSSSVSGGGTPGWCSRGMRASAWTVASCHSSGSRTPSSQTPSAPSCMMSRLRTAWYASSATALFSTPSGTFFFGSRCIDPTRRSSIRRCYKLSWVGSGKVTCGEKKV